MRGAPHIEFSCDILSLLKNPVGRFRAAISLSPLKVPHFRPDTAYEAR
jgi:hypothetical protein